MGGFVDGLIISPVPFGPALAHALIDAGILPRSTPEFREGMLRGELVGGVLCLKWAAGKGPSAAPVNPSRPVPATTSGGAAPPLVVVPNGTAVVVGAGGMVNVAVAAGGMTTALSKGGDGDGSSPPEASPVAPRPIRNARLAGKNHPVTGVPFDAQGFPDFKAAGAVKIEVKITPTRSRPGDRRAANKAAGLAETPEGYIWHHHQDGTTMQLVSYDIHRATGHTGGFSQP